MINEQAASCFRKTGNTVEINNNNNYNVYRIMESSIIIFIYKTNGIKVIINIMIEFRINGSHYARCCSQYSDTQKQNQPSARVRRYCRTRGVGVRAVRRVGGDDGRRRAV